MKTQTMTLEQAKEIAELRVTEYAKELRKALRKRCNVKVSVTVGRGTVATTTYIKVQFDENTAYDYEAEIEKTGQVATALGFSPMHRHEYIVFAGYDRVFYLLAANGWTHEEIQAVFPKRDNSPWY